MHNSQPASRRPDTPSLAGADLDCALSGWLLHGQLEGWSHATIYDRSQWLARLQQFLAANGLAFDPDGLRRFFVTLQTGAGAGARRPFKPASLKHVHALLRAFGSWLVAEDFLPLNPMARIPAPLLKDTSIEPFTDTQLTAILAAARRTRYPHRDTAIILTLADTGVRASELCAIRLTDLDLAARTARIASGKGGRPRHVAFGKQTAHAIWRHLRDDPREPDDFLFATERGHPMTRATLVQLTHRIGDLAGVARVHPHRFRHDACCRLLRNGAHVFAVQTQMGHSRVSTTEIYVKIAAADLREMHRIASPIDNLKSS